jgi:hypothetical protein
MDRGTWLVPVRGKHPQHRHIIHPAPCPSLGLIQSSLPLSFYTQPAMSEDGVKKSSNPLVSLTAGCIAGAIECVSVWPMEYIKTQLQLSKKVQGVKPPYTGMVEGLVYTVRTTGFLSLYRGLSVTLVSSDHMPILQFNA